MKSKKLSKALEYIDDDLISEAVSYKKAKKNNRMAKFVAMAACLCLTAVCLISLSNALNNKDRYFVDTEGTDSSKTEGTEEIKSEEKANTDNTSKGIGRGNSPGTETDTHSENADTSAKKDPGGSSPPIGGSHMGDELYGLYDSYVDIVSFKKGTFTENSENIASYIDGFDKIYRIWYESKGSGRPSLMYYLVQEMGLTREDLETYYAAVGAEHIPENIYTGLMADTLEESMQILKSEYTFYNDGKLYNVYDIYDLHSKNSLPFDVCAPEYSPVWQSIDDYLESKDSYYVITYSEVLKQFVKQMAEASK